MFLQIGIHCFSVVNGKVYPERLYATGMILTLLPCHVFCGDMYGRVFDVSGFMHKSVLQMISNTHVASHLFFALAYIYSIQLPLRESNKQSLMQIQTSRPSQTT